MRFFFMDKLSLSAACGIILPFLPFQYMAQYDVEELDQGKFCFGVYFRGTNCKQQIYPAKTIRIFL
jgi:hypothetical protein